MLTKRQIISKYEYHSALAAEAEEFGNEVDMTIEDARAELALWHVIHQRYAT